MQQFITRITSFLIWILFIPVLGLLPVQAQAPVVSNRQPARHTLAAPPSGPVQLTFTQAISAASALKLRVYGSQARGLRPGTLSGGGTSTLSFAPTQAFAPGERVSVSVPPTLTGTNGSAASRQVYEFWVATAGMGKGFFLDTLRSAGASSRDVLLGDLDNDGDLDLVTNAGLYGMFSYLNNGQGRFTAHYNTVVGQTPSGATLADVNQDGYLDLLAGDADNGTVGIALSDSTGSFGTRGLAAQHINVGVRPVSVAAGDVDGDGDLDFVAANYGSNTVTVGYNSGVGRYSPFTSVATVPVGSQPTTVQLADVDSDGDLDLLTSNSGSNSVSVRFNNGMGAFSGNVSVAVGTAPSDLALTDLDGDGDLDLVTTNAGAASLSVRLNNGLGVFGGTGTLTLPPGSTPNALRLGDVDADGDMDAVVAQGTGGQVITFLNDGASGLLQQYGSLEMAASAQAIALGVVLGDVDGDGDLDVATVDGRLNQVVIGRNGMAPPVVAPTLTALTPAAGPVGTTGVKLAGTNLSSTTAVYFNGVSASFLVVSNQLVTATVPAGATSGLVSVRTVGGSATSAQSFFVTAGPVAPVLVVATVPSRNAQNVSATAAVQATFASPIEAASAAALRVFGSQRRGAQAGPVGGGNSATLGVVPSPAFAPGERVQMSLPAALTGTAGGSVQAQVVDFRVATGGTGEGVFDAAGSTSTAAGASFILKSADFDADGDLDLVSCSSGSKLIELRLNNGSGTFASSPASLPALGGSPTDVAVGDVDADGDLDLLVTESGNSDARLNVWLNNGQGRFAAGPSLSLPGSSSGLLVGDLDADGDLDVAVKENYEQVRVAFNNGSGVFALGGVVTVGNIFYQRLADLDADGDLDVLTLNFPSSALPQFVALLNDGQGTLLVQPATSLPTAQLLYDLVVGDLTGDGLPDAVVLSTDYYAGTSTTGQLTVYPGLGKGQFDTRPLPQAVSRSVTALALADVNADGNLDAVVSATTSPVVQLLTLLGDGHGRLRLPTMQPLATPTDAATALTLADFDGDGDLDLAFANNPKGQLEVRFNHGRPAPTITALSPASGPVGTRVLITGTNLLSTRQVLFGGVAASEVQVLSSTQCAAVVPANATTGAVSVSTASGVGTSAGRFTVVTPVALVGFSPARQATSVPVSSPVQATFGQALGAGAASNLVVRSELRQGRRTGTAAGAGTAQRSFTPTLPYAAGERVQVTLPVPGGSAAGSPMAQVYDFVAAASGPGRGNLRWSSYGAYKGGVLGDFDEDGAPDMLSNDAVSNRMLLLFNDGRGRLGVTRQTILPYANVNTMLPADLNSDSHLDLVLSEQLYQGGQLVSRLVWRAGAGDGTFGASQLLHFFSQPAQSLTVGDLNADGLPDLVALIPQTDSVVVTLNQGNGTFKRQAGTTAAPYANDLRLADYNNDGILDLFTVGNGTNLLYCSLGVGTGEFVPQLPVLLPGQGAAVEVGDVNGDGNLDVLVGTPTTTQGSVQVLLGNGQGSFNRTQGISLDGRASYLHLADMDADGDLDLLAGNVNSYNGMQLYLNTGAGQFATPTTVGQRIVPSQTAVADLDLDGSLDLVLGGDSSISNSSFSSKAGFFVHLNRPLGPVISSFTPGSGGVGTVVTVTGLNLGPVTGVTVGGGPVAFTVVSATQLTLTIDANALTGFIAVTSPNGPATSADRFILPPPTISSFTPGTGAVQRLITLTGSYLKGATVVSFNGTNAPGFKALSSTELTVLVPNSASTGPLRVTTPSGTAVSAAAFTFDKAATGLLPGRNARNVAPSTTLSLDFSQPVSATAAAQLRVFGSLRQGRRTGALAGAGTSQLAFNPTQDFAPGELVSVTLPTSVLGMQGQVSSKQVYQFRAAVSGTGRGTFGPDLNTPFRIAPSVIRLGDMDGDGDLDQVGTIDTNGADLLSVALNNGNGTFAAPTYSYLASSYQGLQLGDFDADGDLDMVALYDAGMLGIWLNTGTGQLASPQLLSLTSGGANLYRPFPMEVGDLDGDGDLDLLTGDANRTTLLPLLNDGTGRFSNAPTQSVGSYCSFLRLADFDSDGDLDALVVEEGNSYAGRGSVLRVRLNDGNGTFSGTYELALANEPNALEIGDMDGDGTIDAVITDAQSFGSGTTPQLWGVTVLRGDGAAHFTVGSRRALPTTSQVAEVLVLGDVDADGDLDVLTSGGNFTVSVLTNIVRLFLNDGNAVLASTAPLPNFSVQYCLALGDLDGDGDLDLAGENNAERSVTVRLNGPAVPLATSHATVVAGSTLYPNPAHGQFTLQVPAGVLPQAGTLVLLNTLGQRVHEQYVPAAPAGGAVSVTVPDLPPGLYLVRLLVAGALSQPAGQIVLE